MKSESIEFIRAINQNENQNIKHLKCEICENIPWNPVTCRNCGELFCEICIENYIITKDNNKECPKCNMEFFKEEAHKSIKKILNDLIIKCKNFECEELLNYNDLKMHEETCPFSLILCKNCNLEIQAKEFILHYKNCKEKNRIGKNQISKKTSSYHLENCIPNNNLNLINNSLNNQNETESKNSFNEDLKIHIELLINEKISNCLNDNFRYLKNSYDEKFEELKGCFEFMRNEINRIEDEIKNLKLRFCIDRKKELRKLEEELEKLKILSTNNLEDINFCSKSQQPKRRKKDGDSCYNETFMTTQNTQYDKRNYEEEISLQEINNFNESQKTLKRGVYKSRKGSERTINHNDEKKYNNSKSNRNRDNNRVNNRNFNKELISPGDSYDSQNISSDFIQNNNINNNLNNNKNRQENISCKQVYSPKTNNRQENINYKQVYSPKTNNKQENINYKELYSPKTNNKQDNINYKELYSPKISNKQEEKIKNSFIGNNINNNIASQNYDNNDNNMILKKDLSDNKNFNNRQILSNIGNKNNKNVMTILKNNNPNNNRDHSLNTSNNDSWNKINDLNDKKNILFTEEKILLKDERKDSFIQKRKEKEIYINRNNEIDINYINSGENKKNMYSQIEKKTLINYNYLDTNKGSSELDNKINFLVNSNDSSINYKTSTILDLENTSIKKTIQCEDYVRCILTIKDSSSNYILISGHNKGNICFWSLENSKLQKILKEHTNTVWDLHTYLNDKFLSASSDFTIKLWNLEINNSLLTIKLDCTCFGLAFLSTYNPNYIAISGYDRKINIYDINKNRKVNNFISDSANFAQRILFLEKIKPFNLFLTANYKDIKLWNLETHRQISSFNGHLNWVYGIEYLKDNLFVSVSNDKTIRIWDVKDGRCNKVINGHNNYVNCVVSLHDIIGEYCIMTGSSDLNNKIFDINKGVEISNIKREEEIFKMIVIENNKKIYIISCGNGNTKYIRIWCNTKE